MGCFCSKARDEGEAKTVHEEYPARPYAGLQVQASAAEAGKPVLRDWHVHTEATYLFAALCATNEGKPCSRKAHEVCTVSCLTAQHAVHAGDLCRNRQRAQAFVALAHLPLPDRLQAALQQAVAAAGANSCLAYLDAATQRLSLARAGLHAPGANAVLGSLVHGLACQAASASFVFPPGAGHAVLTYSHSLASLPCSCVAHAERCVRRQAGTPGQPAAASATTVQLTALHEHVIRAPWAT